MKLVVVSCVLAACLGLGQTLSDQYIISDEPKNWTDARDYCKTIGGVLAVVETEEENWHIENVLRFAGFLIQEVPVWIGGVDPAQDGEFVWESTGQPISQQLFQNWHLDEPNLSAQYCMSYWPRAVGFKWDNNWCDWVIHFICERNVTKVEP